jgi:hypothetical protein
MLSIFYFLQDSPENILAIAQIHAGVLSIFLGAFFAYLLYFSQKQKEMENELLQLADEINYLPDPGGLHPPFEGIYVSNDENNRTQLLERLQRTVSGMHEFDQSVPSDLSDRGEEVLRILTAITHYYPFPNRFAGMVGSPVTEPEDITFKSIDEVRKWLSDLDSVADPLFIMLFYQTAQVKVVIDAYLRGKTHPDPAQSELFQGQSENPMIKDLNRTFKEIRMQELNQIEIFRNFVRQARKISDLVKRQLNRINAAKAIRPKRIWLILSLFFSAVAFICGVILPMISPYLSALYYIWIPVIIYALIFVALFKIVIWNY